MRKRQLGMTLIELTIAIVVLGICVVSVLALLSSLSMRSASAMTRSQATAVAAAYLENILAQPYGNILAYNNTNDPRVFDANGNAVAGLGAYSVQIRAYNQNLGVPPNDILAVRVDVSVTDPTGGTTQVSGFRTSFVGQVLY